MDQPYKSVRSEVKVIVGGVSSGEQPSVTVIYETVGWGKVSRRIVRQLAVPNPLLFQRLVRGRRA